MRGDLHVHSIASDGTLTPSELVIEANRASLDVLAIADHDTLGGQAEALEAAESSGLRVIPAVELSCTIEDLDVHVLGYHIRWDDPVLVAALEELKSARLRRAQRVVDSLNRSGLRLTLDDVLVHAAGGAVGRSHIARALVSHGHADSVPSAFERFIGRGRPFYLPKEAQSVREAVDIIHAAGGAAIIAHPGLGGVERVLDDAVAAGIDGVEVYHAEHTTAQRTFFAAYAAERGLLASGGTDFHGPEAHNPWIGTVDVPSEAIESLLEWSSPH